MLRYKDLFCSCVVVHYINWISWKTASLLELQELDNKDVGSISLVIKKSFIINLFNNFALIIILL